MNELSDINVSNNQLTNFPYHNLNPTTLTKFRIDNNNLQSTKLTVFRNLLNLKEL